MPFIPPLEEVQDGTEAGDEPLCLYEEREVGLVN